MTAGATGSQIGGMKDREITIVRTTGAMSIIETKGKTLVDSK